MGQPIALVLTKADLLPNLEDGVTLDRIKEKKQELGLQLALSTSSKEWEDFNTHKAFNSTLLAAYKFKYLMEGEDSDDDEDEEEEWEEQTLLRWKPHHLFNQQVRQDVVGKEQKSSDHVSW